VNREPLDASFMVQTLETAPLIRMGATNAGAFNASKSFRKHLDFIVDGQSLHQLTGAGNYDLIGTLGWAGFDRDATVVRQLLLDVPPDAPEARQSIFVCAECGDLGCGGITAVVERSADFYTWKDFAYQNDYDESMTDRESFEFIGPYTFQAVQYRGVFNRALFGNAERI